ncbi:MAG: NAD-dependent epimerase/dehydratase family protein [Bacteroidia bacterium]
MILLTGATGFLGSHVLYQLLLRGEKVRATKRVTSSLENVKRVFKYYGEDKISLLQNVEWVEADLLDIFAVEDALKGIDEVYHCAAVVSFNPKDKETMLKTNARGTENLVNAALEQGVKKFCHVSSIAALGRNTTKDIVTENTWWKPSPKNSDYSVSKYRAEREVWRASEEGLQVVIVNPSVIIGPGDFTSGAYKMMQQAFKGIPFYTNGATAFVDVRDVADAMIHLMKTDVKNERYIVSAANVSYRYFFDLMHDAFGKKRASIKVNKTITQIARYFDMVKSIISGKEQVITADTVNAVNSVHFYDNSKLINKLEKKYIPIEKSVSDMCEVFLKYQS